ncbi:MAG TPA: squalene/phytoene synthase family protein [Mycobacteriales bacterium]|jgi:phytoene synthase|nr:squalene/phytoene synthase family protein [Mycobacteriales bacterium]
MTASTLPSTLAEAYRDCESITRTEARNFFWGIRLLPPAQRRGLCAVYALARRIDDIGDGDLPAAQKLERLAEVRAGVARIGSSTADPVLFALADAGRRFPLPLSAFEELVDGVVMDVQGRTYQSFDDLVVYCRRVAGTVGRLCLGVYGARDLPRASQLADDLGVALQQTNILRDVREDLRGGRIYLPQNDLDGYGVTLVIGPDGRLGGPPEAVHRLVRAAASRAEEWYARGLQLLDLLDRRSAACTAAMAGIYVRLNARLAADPALMTTGRLSLSAGEKTHVALRALAGRRP